MRLIKSEHVPSCCGVVVEAEIQGCTGTVMVEPERMLGLDLDEMVVEPDESGRVSVVVANPSPKVVNLQMLGVAYQCAEVSQGGGKAVTGADWGCQSCEC